MDQDISETGLDRQELKDFVQKHFGYSIIPKHWETAFEELYRKAYRHGFTDGYQEAVFFENPKKVAA